uniref:Uncharacterized protein n=1 Tax=Macaca nemestrina TaxID=9545 RepID=A0A2K6E3T7_MACNE
DLSLLHPHLRPGVAAVEPGRASAPSTAAPAKPEHAPQPSLFHLLLREGKMSKSSSKSSQPLASKQKKDGTEKRGRGSPGTLLVWSQKEPSEIKNKGAAKTRKTTTTPGRKPRERPKKLEKEEEKGISQDSSPKEQLPSGTGQL